MSFYLITMEKLAKPNKRSDALRRVVKVGVEPTPMSRCSPKNIDVIIYAKRTQRDLNPYSSL